MGFGIHINVDEIYARGSERKYVPCSYASPQCIVLKRSPPVASLTQGTVIIVINGIVKHYLFLVGVIAKDASF